MRDESGGPVPAGTETLGFETTEGIPAGTELARLVALARDKSLASRKALTEIINNLFCQEEQVLSECERALMLDILSKLLRELEIGVRRDIAERLTLRAEPPLDLIRLLANEEIEVARPLLLHCMTLQEPDLIEIIRHRTMQHQLAIAMRRQVSEPVSDALVATGNVDVIKTLLDNPNAAIAAATMEHLVEESRRVDSYQEPLVRRADLPPRLVRRLCLWVGAALRLHITAHFEIDPTELDDAIEAAVADSGAAAALAADSREPEAPDDATLRLARRLAAEGKLRPELMPQVLRQGEVALFEALFAEYSQLRMKFARRIVYKPGGEGLAVACRALGIDKPLFTSIFLLSRKGRPGDRVVDPAELSRAIAIYDRVKREAALNVLKRWRRSPDYLYALERSEATQARLGLR